MIFIVANSLYYICSNSLTQFFRGYSIFKILYVTVILFLLIYPRSPQQSQSPPWSNHKDGKQAGTSRSDNRLPAVSIAQ